MHDKGRLCCGGCLRELHDSKQYNLPNAGLNSCLPPLCFASSLDEGQRFSTGWTSQVQLMMLLCASCRSEQRIAVVTHCGFLFYLLSSFGHECSLPVANSLHKTFDNCEMRSFVITDAAGPPRPDPTCFGGGRSWLASSQGPRSHP